MGRKEEKGLLNRHRRRQLKRLTFRAVALYSTHSTNAAAATIGIIRIRYTQVSVEAGGRGRRQKADRAVRYEVRVVYGLS